MPHSLMLKCEKKKQFLRQEKRIWEWVVVPVSTLARGCNDKIRCKHCHGQVRLHNQHVTHGPADHVQHVSQQDSKNCKGGRYFEGEHRMSLDPVQ